MSKEENKNVEANSGGGRAALEGFLYQIRMSVFVALEIVLAQKLAKAITLEPASEEDLEASIDFEPDALTGTLEMPGYQLIVQCKLKTTGPWSIGDVKRLLAHGTERAKPQERLSHAKARYLLFTNADLSGVARQLSVKNIGEWPGPNSIPPTLAPDLPADAPGRLAILNTIDDEKLAARTNRLLKERFHVPDSQLSKCAKALQDAALERMRGVGAGVWDLAAIERLIVEHSGYVGLSDAITGYVQPTNWSELTATLETQHAIIIKGASGTGKTRTAKALIADLREKTPGINHIYVERGPESVLAYAGNDVVFEIEDPWGRYRVEPAAQAWNDKLNDMLRSANEGRKFVVTTRSDVLLESHGNKLDRRWFVRLEEENYGIVERGKLFDGQLRSVPRNVQSLVLSYKKTAVTRLGTPLEMVRLFSAIDEGSLSPEVLALTADKSSTVKKHLIKLLEQYGLEKCVDSLVALAADQWNNSSHHEEEPNFPIAQAAAKLLLEGPHTIDADLSKRLDVIVQKSADSAVKLLLLRVIVRRGTPDTKKKVAQIATGRAGGALPRLTANALVSEAEHVDAVSLAEISDDILRTRSAVVSCLLTLLLALRANEERILS